MEIELSFHISWLLRTVWVSWFGIRQFDIFPYFDDILHICPFFAKQLFSILRYSYSSNINTLNLKLWTHRALTAASRSIGMHCDAALTLENRSHPPPPPIFKRHNAFQWTLTLPLTLGVFIPLVGIW